MKILDFGSCNIDSVYSVSHIVRPGETLSVEDYQEFPGGKGLNQAIAIAKAGAKVHFAGCIGKDGAWLQALMQQAGVDVTYLKVAKERTGQAIIQVDNNGENSIFIYHGANAAVSKEHIDQVLTDFNEGDILLLQNEISNLSYLIERAFAKGMKIILNPSPFVPELKEIDLSNLFCVILNETEAAQFAGTENPFDFLTYVKRNYPALQVVLTLGKKGSVYLCDEKIYRHQAFTTPVVDTTAAGDTFTGYMIAGIYKGMAIRDIFRKASAAAAIAISRNGAASSIPEDREVEELMDSMVLNLCDDVSEQKQLVHTYIATHLTDVQIGDIAELLNYTKEYTSRWIKQHFSMNFSDLLQQERCESAAELLVNTTLPVSQIIQLTGYNNGSFFREIFQKHYGMLPLEYRKKMQAQKQRQASEQIENEADKLQKEGKYGYY